MPSSDDRLWAHIITIVPIPMIIYRPFAPCPSVGQSVVEFEFWNVITTTIDLSRMVPSTRFGVIADADQCNRKNQTAAKPSHVEFLRVRPLRVSSVQIAEQLSSFFLRILWNRGIPLSLRCDVLLRTRPDGSHSNRSDNSWEFVSALQEKAVRPLPHRARDIWSGTEKLAHNSPPVLILLSEASLGRSNLCCSSPDSDCQRRNLRPTFRLAAAQFAPA